MYSGLLPKGLTDFSSDDEDDQGVANQEIAATNVQRPAIGLSHGLKQNCVTLGDTSYSCIQPFIEHDPCLDSLPGISEENWQKCKEQQKKKDEINTMTLPQKRPQRKGRYKKDERSATKNMESNNESREPQAEHERRWDGLTQYFGINDRFQPPACSKPAPKLAVKIAQATDCRDFVQSKQEVEASRAAQKRKKQIAWGFEAKQRWETKSNMGYM
ncbi:protein FAM204A-like isoform X5 [Salvelinus fontinalis]|uniref:protein FAM204A-like isoform X5 n=1 Tax=Salvelinus fontinalis TaxID=8038 RepID=UPI0024864B40|nr:protein FAM204A-like isoform X5 [Salvelinus fontinalis]